MTPKRSAWFEPPKRRPKPRNPRFHENRMYLREVVGVALLAIYVGLVLYFFMPLGGF